jgi:hypothetical protein
VAETSASHRSEQRCNERRGASCEMTRAKAPQEHAPFD